MLEGVSDWWRRRSPLARVAIFVVIAAPAFVLAMATGAAVSAVLGGDSVFARWRAPEALGAPDNAPAPEDTDGVKEATVVSDEDEPALEEDETAPEEDETAPEEDELEVGTAASVAPPRWEALRQCERTQAECAEDLFAGVAPQARYAGGRIEPDDSGRTRNVLYFVDPGKQRCEYKRFESAAGGSGTYYVALVAGQGSFAPEQYSDGGEGCVPDI